MLIDVETYEYFSVHSAGSEGVLVLIQHYRDIPLMRKESFVLSPGSIEYSCLFKFFSCSYIFRAIFDLSNKIALLILRRMYALYVK